MPARNAEATIGMAIQSCLSQTLPNFELVLVDHSSTDGTYSLMKKFARQDSRVQVVKARSGSSFISAANQAWHEAQGELIARMDSDDFAYSAKLQHQVRFLAENPDMGACATQVRIRKRAGGGPPDKGYADYETWINSVVSPADIANQRFIDSPIPNPTALIRRSVLEKFDGYADRVWAEDYDLWLRLMEAGVVIGKVERVLLDWYDSDSRATRQQSRYSLENFQLAKAHYLARLDPVIEKGVAICGAGPIGKRIAKMLKAEGIFIEVFFEVNEKQIGNQIGGVPVIGSEGMAEMKNRVILLGAVGSPGGRQRIRDLALPLGFIEGEDFFCVA